MLYRELMDVPIFLLEKLCDKPFGATNYFGLFNITFIGIPIFGLHNKSVAHMFLTLVDVI